MPRKSETVLLPVETQTRELDGKLLLGCFLAERGVRAIVGSRIEMHLKIGQLPVGLYHGKDVRRPSKRIIRIMKRLGHRITALDEEAVVYYTPSSYHQHRVSDSVMTLIDDFIAWGDDNRQLIETAPGFRGQPVHVTGNPRIDFLRPELRGYFDEDVQRYRQRFGDFVMINSNFGSVNHYFPNLSRADEKGVKTSGNVPPDGFMAQVFQFRYDMLQAFYDMLPKLADSIPDTPIIVRPHPAENHDSWRRAAQGRNNVHVLHEGNVYGWLLASRVKIHNGCTTAIESFMLGQPSICFRPIWKDNVELELPNKLSHRAENVETLIREVRNVIVDNGTIATTEQQSGVAERYFEALDGPLAAERTADILAGLVASHALSPCPPVTTRIPAHIASVIRAGEKKMNAQRQAHKNSVAYSKHRFPGVSVDDVNQRLKAYGKLLGRFSNVRASAVGENLFSIQAEV